MKKLILFTLIIFCSGNIFSQNKIDRIEPPNWWVGMQEPEVQLLVHGDAIGNLEPKIEHPGVQLKRVIKVENPNYLFLDLHIAEDAKTGKVKIDFFQNGKALETHDWELWQREAGSAERQGYDNSDVMYLITPDRFANGDPSNDKIEGMLDPNGRDDKWGRHGGDIRGVINSLDYLDEMGFTAIWLNPVLENDQPQWSYHGYATTDFYQVDRRFGNNAEYRELAEKAQAKGVKVIMDMIMNHCGSEHWWMNDLPSDDWVNNPDNFFQTNHKRTTLRDPYTSEYDREHFADGWFVSAMPDMNQRNPMMAKYLIQNTIWWIEYLGLAGIRMDTYPYSDMHFMTDWTCAVMNEYPNFNICGEEWSLNPAVLAYWQEGKINPDGYTSCLKGLLDFPLQHALVESLKEEENWNSGFIKLYEMLSNDFLYADPFKHVIFPDNHDMSRIFTQLGEDVDLFKMAMVYFATMRGTPQFYYGTEILMSNTGDDSHGNIRSDFPGGWKGDAVNAYTGEGLTKTQLDAQNFVKKLLNWRRTASAVHSGKLTHFAPADNVYVYFRYDDEQRVMVILNKNENPYQLDLSRFGEMLEGVTQGVDVISGKAFSMDGKIALPVKAPLVLELK